MPKYQVEVHMAVKELWRATLDIEATDAQTADVIARARVQGGEDCWESAEIVSREFSFRPPVEEEDDA